jgi:hypothetical protein
VTAKRADEFIRIRIPYLFTAGAALFHIFIVTGILCLRTIELLMMFFFYTFNAKIAAKGMKSVLIN